jgi:hypothetical protein
MTFLQSLFLAGLAAAVIPVIIHLLNRPRARVVPFSTLEFIRRLQIKRSRRLRVRELLLLVLRVLLVALIALAFARPALQGAFAGGVGGRARTSACIVLDVSYSMGFREGEATLLDRAKDRAHQIVRLLRERDGRSSFSLRTRRSRGSNATHDFAARGGVDRAPSARAPISGAPWKAVRLLEGSRGRIADLPHHRSQAVSFPPEREGRPLPTGDVPRWAARSLNLSIRGGLTAARSRRACGSAPRSQPLEEAERS